MKPSVLLLLLVTLLSRYTALPAAAQPVILNSSPSVKPGEAISLQGSFGAAAQVYLSVGTSTTGQLLPVLLQSKDQATVQLPTSVPLGLYQLWVQDGGQRSLSVFVNQARGMHYDSPEVVPEDTVRVFGRNLLLSGSLPQVRFVQPGTGTSTTVTLTSPVGSDAYKLLVRIPTGLAHGIYDVYVSNGLGGPAGETKVEQQLTVLLSGRNPFKLPVGWGTKFTFASNVYDVQKDSVKLGGRAKGNGIADDRPVIQAAIDKAAAAMGGVVYLPAGTYKLMPSGWGGLEMRSRVVVRGAGAGQTIIQYGFPDNFPKEQSRVGVHVDSATTTFGLVDLTMENVSANAAWQTNMYTDDRGGGIEFMLSRVEWKLKLGERLNIQDYNKVCIVNCTFIQDNTWTAPVSPHYSGTVRLDGSRNIWFAHNELTYATGGISFGDTKLGICQNVVMENNELDRDGSANWPIAVNHKDELVNHMASFNFCRNLANLNNVYRVIKDNPQNINDGESIIAEQGAGYHPDEAVGTVTSATDSTLTDASKAWPIKLEQKARGIAVGVAIVYGKGMGQWRPIASRTANVLTLKSPWAVVPDVTSRYAIYAWGAENWLVQGNRLENNQRGITIYHNASRDLAVVGNTLLNSGSIDFSPTTTELPNPADTTRRITNGVYPVWNCQVVNNAVSDINGKMGVFIGVHTIQYINPHTFGTTVLGFEVRGNTLTAHVPNDTAKVDTDFKNGYYDGLRYQGYKDYYLNEGIPVALGTIFQNNTAVNCDAAVHLGTGSYNALVCNMNLVGATTLLDDVALASATNTTPAAVNKRLTCPDAPTLTLRTPENPANTVAGLNYQYYQHPANLDRLPDFATLTPVRTGVAPLPTLLPSPQLRPTNYSLRYTGYVTVPTDGQYTFYTNSDDGSQLYIGSTLVVDNDWSHWFREVAGTIGLKAGTHALTVTYFQNDGDQALDVSYAGPGLAKRPLPATALQRAAPPVLYRVNAGGGAVTTSLGAFAADQYYQGGVPYATTATVVGTSNGALYQSERFGGAFSYSFPVANGKYTVVLHFAEIYWSRPGQRVFDVALEGVSQLRNYDIVGKVGPLTAITETIPVTVTDGRLDISFTTSVDQAKVSAIEVLSGSTSSRAAAPLATMASIAGRRLQVYPNLSQGSFSVTCAATTAQTATLTLTDVLGQVVHQQAVQLATGPNLLAVQTGQLPEGLYQLALLDTAGGRQTQSVLLIR